MACTLNTCSNFKCCHMNTDSATRFLLLHNKSMDEKQIKRFFNDLYHVYLKLLMNPFYLKGSPITNIRFKQEVQRIGKQHFRG